MANGPFTITSTIAFGGQIHVLEVINKETLFVDLHDLDDIEKSCLCVFNCFCATSAALLFG